MPRFVITVLSKALDWMAERQQRCTMRELQRLDDRTLVGIGLAPDEIAYLVRSGLGARSRGRRRALIAKSSLGIMGAAPSNLAAQPVQCSLLVLFAALGALLPLGIIAAAASAY